MRNSTLLAFVAGAAVGAAVALLSSPVSGEELRNKIKARHRKMREELDDMLESKLDDHMARLEEYKAKLEEHKSQI